MKKVNRKLLIFFIVVLVFAGLLLLGMVRYNYLTNHRQVDFELNVIESDGCSYDSCRHNCYSLGESGFYGATGIGCMNVVYHPSKNAVCKKNIANNCKFSYKGFFFPNLRYDVRMIESGILTMLYK